MSLVEAILLGVLQGMTEFLPISSSGHLALGTAFLSLQAQENLLFSLFLHTATAISTTVIFRKKIAALCKNIYTCPWNPTHQWTLYLCLSAIPVAGLGLAFEDTLEAFFDNNLLGVGICWWATGLLLLFSKYSEKHAGTKNITLLIALLMGVAQAIALLPGISRSGATIATGLLLGAQRKEVAHFSFLMVLIPIFGATFIKGYKWMQNPASAEMLSWTSILGGSIAAFLVGLLACRWMITWVQQGKLFLFSFTAFLQAP